MQHEKDSLQKLPAHEPAETTPAQSSRTLLNYTTHMASRMSSSAFELDAVHVFEGVYKRLLTLEENMKGAYEVSRQVPRLSCFPSLRL